MTRTVGILLYDQVEALDFTGPFEVFTTASRMALRTQPSQPPPFQVVPIARTGAPVTARAGLVLVPGSDFASHPPIDVLIVPGGVVDDALRCAETIAWIARTAGTAELTASVCTGAFLLARAGLLVGRRATTHWEDVDDLSRRFPDLAVIAGPRWIDEGAVVTSAGISAGIDMSLHLVGRLAGRALAERTARQMDFDWTETTPPPR